MGTKEELNSRIVPITVVFEPAVARNANRRKMGPCDDRRDSGL